MLFVCSVAPCSLRLEQVQVTKVVDRCYEATGQSCFICDFSPPRSGSPAAIRDADLEADFISVAYNPGRAVRTNSAMLAASIRQQTGKDVVFTLATRDMNRLAIQSLLLGAQLLGLKNVLVVQGDPFGQRDLASVAPVNDYTPTALVAAIKSMNEGADFRGSQLREPTNFCVGATFDLSRGIEAEAGLAVRKVRAGADFLLSQPIFDPSEAARLEEAFLSRHGWKTMPVPVFYGLQMLEPDGVTFSAIPEETRVQLDAGRSGIDIALELHEKFQEAGLHNVYLVPPIRRGGARNYAAAREFLERRGRGHSR